MVEEVKAYMAGDGTLHMLRVEAEKYERQCALVHELSEWLIPEADVTEDHAIPLAENLIRDWEIVGRKTASSRMSDSGRTDAFIHKGTVDKVYLKRWLCHRASWTPFALSEGLLQDFKIERLKKGTG